MSAACILFLFWSITHLVKKLICPDDKEMTLGKLITIMGDVYKRQVRRMLQTAGFTVERLPGPPGGKREILRATKSD